MENFAKYYEMPLRIDDYCPDYIWTKDNKMAFNYIDEEKIDNRDLTEIYEIVNAINGYRPGKFNASINPKHVDIVQIDGIDKLLISGWGNLTGQGSHNLNNEDAIRVQNNFAKWIVEQLRRNLEDE